MPYSGSTEEVREKKHNYYLATVDVSTKRSANWKKQNPELAKLQARRTKVKQTYGISLEQYDELLLKQDNRCAVCKKHQSELKKRLCIDHDHKSGEIRGLLCIFCNRVIVGRLRGPEGVRLFLNASKYLEGGTGWVVPPKPKKKRKKRHAKLRCKTSRLRHT